MIIKRKKPSWVLVFFGILITGIILLGMLLRVFVQNSLGLLTLKAYRKKFRNGKSSLSSQLTKSLMDDSFDGDANLETSSDNTE